ncbi:MAG: site-specific DNA-methyltransferase [Bacteroidetes bacterium]|nr:MAG: site-specific DNA-methyltransferase [Bacteroidota bacterium]
MTTPSNIVQKVWSFCDTLRDDGLGYTDYLEQLTYLLFLKMADENVNEYILPNNCNWQYLRNTGKLEVGGVYEEILQKLSESGGMLEKIFSGAKNKIHDTLKLQRLIMLIDEENWTSQNFDVKGEIYESLLQKNAENSGAGQYFTPRAIIASMVECIQPKEKDKVSDPSCGTGGFFLGVLDFFQRHNVKMSKHIKFDMFKGWEIEPSTARLCLMNLFLHGVGDLKETPDIEVTDSLKRGNEGKVKDSEKVDIILANPPFGISSSDIPTVDKKQSEKDGYFLRVDFWVTTSNKQLAFLQHIVAMLNENGRAAVVLPDNVLFEGGAGETIRKKLLEETDLHTILRLPTGIFYAQGVKANVLFFEKRKTDVTPLTKEVWYYDYRTNVRHTPKKNPLRVEHLKEFVECYQADDRTKRMETWSVKNEDGRWRKYNYKDLISRDKTNLDIFWLKDDKLIDLDNLPDPEILLDEIIDNIESALASFKSIKENME